MDAKAKFYALALSAALVMTAGVMLSNDAMSQTDYVTVQGDEAPVETGAAAAPQADDVTVQGDEAPVETGAAAAPQADDVTAQDDVVAAQDDDVAIQDDDVAVQDEAVTQPVSQQKPAVVERPVKSDLDQTAVRAAPITRAPRPTRTSTSTIAVPKILGSYR